MRDALNRQMWAIDQRKQARAAFAVTVKPVEIERAERLAGLRAMADMLSTMPTMGETLASVREQIRSLGITP